VSYTKGKGNKEDMGMIGVWKTGLGWVCMVCGERQAIFKYRKDGVEKKVCWGCNDNGFKGYYDGTSWVKTEWGNTYVLEDKPGHNNRSVEKGIAVLEEAWQAVERGIPLSPSVGYMPKKAAWRTVEGRERLISLIDAEFTTELAKSVGYFGQRGMNKHPRFYRLDFGGRLWLCEKLEEAKGVVVGEDK